MDIKNISAELEAWQKEDKMNRSVIFIAVDIESQDEFNTDYEQNIVVRGKPRNCLLAVQGALEESEQISQVFIDAVYWFLHKK